MVGTLEHIPAKREVSVRQSGVGNLYGLEPILIVFTNGKTR